MVHPATMGPLLLVLLAPNLVDFDAARRSRVKRLPGFLTPAEIDALHESAAAVKALQGTHASVATRDRQLREGGRTVHMNHHLCLLMPELHDRMLRAAHAADLELWRGIIDPSRPDRGVLQDRAAVELRSAEYHDVRGQAEGALPMHLHGDFGSLVTVDLMLSASSEFEGGAFQTEEEGGELIEHTFEQGDALIFLSHKHHGVAPVTAGRRNIAVCEFWEGLQRRCPQRCDQPWAPCHCKYRPLAVYPPRAPDAASAWPPDGQSDSARLRERGLAAHRARLAAERREAAERAAERAAARRAAPRAAPAPTAPARTAPAPAAPTAAAAVAAAAAAAAVEEAVEAETAAAAAAAAAGEQLRQRGFAVLAEPVLSAELVAEAAALSGARLRTLLGLVEAAGGDPLEQQYLYREVCHRQRARWDLQLDGEALEQEPAWAALGAAAFAAAAPVIAAAQAQEAQEAQEAQGEVGDGGGDGGGGGAAAVEVVQRGVLVSRPGARVQRLHVDATNAHFAAAAAAPTCRLYSIFVPLVDLAADDDGTEFWPTAELAHSTRALAKHMLGADDAPLDPADLEAPSRYLTQSPAAVAPRVPAEPPTTTTHTAPPFMRPMCAQAPACCAGGLIVFDYRTIHRGLPNEGERERPVAYLVCATGGATDAHNFPAERLREARPGDAADFPVWNAPGHPRAQDDLDYYTEIEGDPFALPPA